MTYDESIEALRGHPLWWFYDLQGSDRQPDRVVRERVQVEAIELAKTWVKPEKPAMSEAELKALLGCCDGGPFP